MIEPYLSTMKQHCGEEPHGTRSRYVSGCKCVPCRAANSRYQSQRFYAIRDGDWNGFVSAATARGWLERLSKRGVGRHSVSAASGVSGTILWQVITGERLKIRARTERKILAVDESCRADHSHVAAGPTWKRIDELVHRGYTKTWIAKQLGKAAAIQFNRKRVTAKNARAVERLYRMIEDGRVAR